MIKDYSRKFYRNLILISLLVLSAFTGKSQTDIVIGTGTVGNAGTTFPAPLQDWWEGSRAQYLFLASELNAAGMNAGTISAIKLNVTALNTFGGSIEQFTLKLNGTTTASLGTTTWEPAGPTVFGPVDYAPVLGTNIITFNTPFFWNGTDNIVVEICNGDPANGTYISYTNNLSVPWTTGLAFNASRTYAVDNAGNLCASTDATNGSIFTYDPTTRPNLTFSWLSATPCTGIPTGGTALSSIINVCNPTTPFTVFVTGSTSASGLSYQWQTSPNNTTWTNAAGATTGSYNVTGITGNTFYRRIVTCGAGGGTATSTSVQVTTNAPAYATLPYNESFENTWIDVCNTRDAPNNFWRNTPASGNNSWRRNDDFTGGGWASNNGAYTPAASAGTFSARWHAYDAAAGTKGQFDLFVNCNTAALTKALTFDYINTSGNDSLAVLYSTDGGATFTRIDSIKTRTVWTTFTWYFNSTATSTVIRFQPTGDFGVTDIGIDNLSVVNFPNCSGTPTGGTAVASVVSVCNPTTPFTLSVTGATLAGGLSYQWQLSTNGGATWTNTTGTGVTYTHSGVSTNTSFRRLITCAGNTASSTTVTVSVVAPNYALMPFAESFENNWIDICDDNDAPNNFWRNSPATGNNSWRRDDDGATAIWTGVANGTYTPASTNGAHSARFHTYFAAAGTNGKLDLYINCNTGIATKLLNFDFINTTGNDSLVLYLSTDGGATFTRLDSLRLAATWRNVVIPFTSNSSTSIIRFQGNSDFGVTDIGVDNITINDFPPCSGTPTGGVTQSTLTFVCSNGIPFNLTVSGSSVAASITYQWQSSTNGGTSWSDIIGATGLSYNSPGISQATSFRRAIFCGTLSSTSTPVAVLSGAATYAPLPYSESFENTWINKCDVRDAPNFFWKNSPITGNNSWRREDDGVAAGWTAAATGLYAPPASAGIHSARFHTNQAANGTKGQFEIYVNANTGAPVQRLSFDWINTTGTDSLAISLSINGGLSYTRLDTAGPAASWKTKTILFNAGSATTVIRFEATSDFGLSDIGLDNISIIDWADCTGTPNAGTLTSTTTSVCTESFTVNAIGVTTGNGVNYQWQRSLDNGTTYTNIAGANNFSYTASQVGTSLYRLITTCTFSGQTVTSTSLQIVSPSPGKGAYTINNLVPTNIATRTFQTFADAYNFIKCGIDSAIVFNVINGPYNEQLTLGIIPGATAQKTVTFKGNGTAAIGFGSNNSADRAVFKFRGAKFVILDSLIINANSGTYGYGVQLISNADSNKVRYCTINSSMTATTQNYAGIVINGTDAGPISTGTVLCDFNTFSNNTITGGYYGITLVASFAGGASGNNQFISNDVKDFYQYGMYVGGAYNTLIEKNSFSRPTRANVLEFQGIIFNTEKCTGMSISKNKIFDPFAAATASTLNFFGINFNNSDASVGAENFVSNNLIYNVVSNGQAFGITNTGSDYVFYLHNTVSLDHAASTAAGATRGFYQTSVAGGLYFYNNIITVTRGGAGTKHCIYLGNNLLAGSDNNDFYMNAAAGINSVGFYQSNRTTLGDWIIGTSGLDTRSVSTNPAFTNPAAGNYSPGNAGIDNKGIYVGIDQDILSVARSQSTPDIGAYEFTPPSCSTPPVTGVTSLTPTSICQNSPAYLTLNIGAYGAGQKFQWQSSGTATGTFTNVGTALLSPDTTIFGTTTLYYRAAITCGASTVFTTPVLLNVSPALPAGTYTINQLAANTYVPGVPGGNFVSFNAAKAAMSCGINGGPVVFNVVANSGPYNEQLRLDSIAGTTAVRTITFNGNGNTITFNSNNSTERAVIKLSTTDYIIFDSLRIDAGTGTYGYGVQLINRADSNIFRRCTIINTTAPTSANFCGVVINATETGPITTGLTLCDYNLFDRDSIIGGYYGITLVGGSAATEFISQNRFTNNIIRDFFNTGIYVSGTVNTLIEGNTFSRPTATITVNSINGIFLTTAPSNKITISKNRFTKFFAGVNSSSGTFFGVYHNNVDVTAGNEAVVSNNLFYGMEGNGSLYALYNIGSDGVKYFHNTISLDNAGSTSTFATAGFYQSSAAVNIDFRDNNVTVTRNGSGTKHAIYLNTAASEVNSNYNNLYASGTNAFVGYNGSNRTTLADWQASSLKDANSFSQNPLYADSANGNFRPQLALLDNKGTNVGITTDILNAVRSVTTPDIGAYEFAPVACQIPTIAGTATVTPNTGVCLEVPITLNVNGSSPLGNITFQWQNSVSATGPWTNIGSLQFFPQLNTTTTISKFYRVIVSCGTNSVTSNVVAVNLNNILLAGTYTINPALPANSSNFQSFQAAVNALLCGIGGPVVFNVESGTYNEQIRIPYIPGTSPVNTVTFQSRINVATAVNLTYSSTVAANNYTLKLDSTNNFIFRNMSFTAGNPVIGRVIDLGITSSNNIIQGCRIVAPLTPGSTSNAAVGIFANLFKGTNNTIKGNTMLNGASGIYFSGTSAAILTNPDNFIDSNTVTNASSNGIQVQFTNRIKVRKNTVNLAGDLPPNTAGIYLNISDSAFRLTGNTVNINNVTSGPTYGMYVFTTRAKGSDSAIVSGNTILADQGNTNTVYGLGIQGSKGISCVNNVIAINSSGATAYGLYNFNNIDSVNFYNNTINLLTNSANGYSGYFANTALGKFNVKNNIFSNKGGGKALFVDNPVNYSADYNMLYATGATLVQVSTGVTTTFANLLLWQKTWNWDRTSISFPPQFLTNTDLRPNLAVPDVWAMHGRGTQIRGNTFDFNNNSRPDILTAGVPDLGAFEFFPTALPSVLLATPATPAPNTTQTFSYGTDTVMRITWGSTAPPSIQLRRFSGVVPTGLTPGTDSMYFYVKVDIPGNADYAYSTKLYYIDSWQGSIPQQSKLGLGRTTPSNAWVVGATSKVDVSKKEIRQDALFYLDRFTGLTNPFAQEISDDSSSNRGKDFWVGYQRTNGFIQGNGQDMVIYMGAGAVPANVTVRIDGNYGTPWIRTYFVPANSSVSSEIIPKTGTDDARLQNEGKYAKEGIHITSDVPIVAYAHIYESANSGATMLMPTAVWGYEYYSLSSRQYYGTTGSASVFHIVAKDDSTWVEINPSQSTVNGWQPNGGTQPNGSYLVKLNKGDAYQVLGAVLTGLEGKDLSGSYIKSISNGQGTCHPIAVFAGSTRTGIGCGGSTGSSGDLIIQQIFPYQAWGNKYATAPTTNSTGPSATTNMQMVYRVLVKDPLTVVKRNNVVLTGLVNNRYYQFESSTADYIESNKPILVAEFMSSNSACANSGADGDPEMFYLSPLQQAIKSTQFYRNNLTAITTNYITLVIPTEGLTSLRIDGVNYQTYPTNLRYSYDHPNLPGYTVVTKKWIGGNGSSTVESDFAFTGIVYGEGSVESYGYNLGTLVKNLNNLGSVNNVFNTGNTPTDYTCKGAPFRIRVLLPIKPDSIRWRFSQVPKLLPNVDSIQRFPKAIDTVTVNGIDYYSFSVNQQFTFDSAGIFAVPLTFWSSEIESCDKSKDGKVFIQVLPAPITNFVIGYPGGGTATSTCEGDILTFTGDQVTQNGIALNQWLWTFHDGSTPTGRTQTKAYPTAGTFPVKLKGITADGCISDTLKNVVINPRPVVNVVVDSVSICAGGTATFTVQNPIAGATYRWYDAATGGTLLFTGTTYTAVNVTPLPKNFWVEAQASGCASLIRKKVAVGPLPSLTPSITSFTGSTASTVSFAWTAVPNASSYDVSVNGGPFVVPSSGATGLTHTVSGLSVLQSASIVVRANGVNVCQTSLSIAISGCTNSAAVVTPDSIAVCTGTAAIFNVQNPATGITYRWYTTATGGNPIATGSSFSVTANGTAVYYVEQSSATCIGTPRTRVIVTILAPLAPAVATFVSSTVNSITWSWTAVPNAASYQVSIDNGVTYTTPSSGATGLTHTVNGLQPLQQLTLLVRAIGIISCQTSVSQGVAGRTKPDQIYIPNSFTPNGDGLNDQLLVYGYTIKDMQFAIFNQWGEKIFESTSQTIGWNGSAKGKPQPSGVYLYVGKFTLLDGTILIRKGSINLIR